jgi:anthranilate synthase component 1
MTMTSPLSQAEVKRLAGNADTILLRASRDADLETPVGAFLRMDDGGPAYLLESVEGGERVGRYSFLGVGPRRTLEVRGTTARIVDRPLSEDVFHAGLPSETLEVADPIAAIRAFVPRRTVVPLEGMPRFTLPDIDHIGVSTAAFLETDLVLVFDHLTHTLSAIASLQTAPPDLEGRYRIAERAIFEALERTARPSVSELTPTASARPGAGPSVPVELESPIEASLGREAYEAAVVRAKDAIASGEAIQIVLARRQSLTLPRGTDGRSLDGVGLYRALRRVNPSPYLFFVRTADYEVVGASPELLLQVDRDRMTTHPIAGTRPRGIDDADDERIADELQRDPKERAEHVMLVDLGRNDLGRVARPGTVAVTRYMEVERYSHVLHLVSHVEARLRPDLDALDALKSVFPAGTLSGAPKVRAMQLIAELEGERRGLYGGAAGYIGYDGNLDTAITIRSAVLKDGVAHIHTGAGIVAGSVPEREFEETEHKAAAMRRAIEQAAETLAAEPAAGTSTTSAPEGAPTGSSPEGAPA